MTPHALALHGNVSWSLRTLWGGTAFVFLWTFSIHDFEPITGRIHQPPPSQQTFQGPTFVICSFCPRERVGRRRGRHGGRRNRRRPHLPSVGGARLEGGCGRRAQLPQTSRRQLSFPRAGF